MPSLDDPVRAEQVYARLRSPPKLSYAELADIKRDVGNAFDALGVRLQGLRSAIRRQRGSGISSDLVDWTVGVGGFGAGAADVWFSHTMSMWAGAGLVFGIIGLLKGAWTYQSRLWQQDGLVNAARGMTEHRRLLEKIAAEVDKQVAATRGGTPPWF